MILFVKLYFLTAIDLNGIPASGGLQVFYFGLYVFNRFNLVNCIVNLLRIIH